MSEPTQDVQQPRVVGVIHYLGALVTLLVLTAVSVGIAQFDLSFVNIHVALGLATVQALIVLGLFMNLAFGARVHSLLVGAGVAFAAFFILLTYLDVSGRDYVDPARDTLAAQKAALADLRLQAEKGRNLPVAPVLPDEAVAPEGERRAAPPPAAPITAAPVTDALVPPVEQAAPASH